MVFALLLLIPDEWALAQPAPPMSFIGGGVSWGSDDSEHRITLPRALDAPERRHVFWADAALKGSRWLAVGGEVAFLEPVAGRFITRDGVSNQSHSERVLSGLVRVRAARTGRVGLDLVGGPGILFGHYEASFHDGRTTVATSTDTKGLAWTGGADVSVAIGQGAGLVGVFRLYRLGRGGSDSGLPFQVASTRVLAGVGIRLGV